MLTLGVATIFLKPTAAQDSCPSTWTCYPVSGTSPTLDADLTEWQSIDGVTTSLQSITGTKYEAGDASLKCMFDNQTIFFAFEIPGAYQYNASVDELCAAIGIMTKVGVSATFYNMGGCPDAMSGCGSTGTIPDTCVDYVVDIGAHWQLPSTPKQGFEYGIGKQSVNDEGETEGVVDEFAASPYCRLEDKESNGSNDWYGAWKHTNPTEGMDGTYIFELSRPLSTASATTDAQYLAGGAYDVGVAFWDPNESADGWSDPGHYVTGCANKWIELQLAVSDPSVSSPTGSGAVSTRGLLLSLICVVGLAFL